jgi:transcriptional antiterminator NusG
MATHKKRALEVNQDSAWYVVRSFPGIEMKAKMRMVNTLRAKNLTQPGMQIIVPHDVMVDDHDRNTLAGFVVVKMRMQPDAWKVISNTPGVTGYVGTGVTPTAFQTGDWSQIPFSRFTNSTVI